mgnify:CR=1 FL=1
MFNLKNVSVLISSNWIYETQEDYKINAIVLLYDKFEKTEMKISFKLINFTTVFILNKNIMGHIKK